MIERASNIIRFGKFRKPESKEYLINIFSSILVTILIVKTVVAFSEVITGATLKQMCFNYLISEQSIVECHRFVVEERVLRIL